MEDQRIVYEAIKDRLPEDYTYSKFCEGFKDWKFEYLYQDSKCIGAAMSKDGYIHVAIDEAYRKVWAKKNQIKQLILNAMQEGKAYTTIFKHDEFRANFAKRLGFTMIKDGDIQTYEVKHENLWK